jgi:hypothetical protein
MPSRHTDWSDEIPDSGETGFVPGNELLEKYNLMTVKNFLIQRILQQLQEISAEEKDNPPMWWENHNMAWYGIFSLKYLKNPVIHLSFIRFQSVEKFLDFAQTVLNRRKSRAENPEHHLNAIFQEHHLSFTPNCVTEGNKNLILFFRVVTSIMIRRFRRVPGFSCCQYNL